MEDRALDQKPATFSPLLWAVFLGSSWTWIIGMFLPVLLVRDHGVWGWVVFAVPNVVGAAAMGWVLHDAAASERFVRRHATMCRLFSLVTIAYHVFFAMWMIERLRGWGLAALAIYFVAALLPVKDELRFVGAILAMGLSAAVWWLLYRQGVLAWPVAPLHPAAGHASGGALGAVWLLPAFVMGFALCPYLDLTFHRARQFTSPAGGRFAFGVGFGVVFCSMIVFTLLYARFLAPAVQGEPLGQLTTIFLCAHLIGQSTFTVAAHAKELAPGRTSTAVIAVDILALVAAAALGWFASFYPQRLRGHDLGETIYWCLLGFYGLLFPCYLWISGFAGPDNASPLRGRAAGVLAATIAVAFPMYWMGFIEGRTFWLIPGLAIVLLSRVLVPRRATIVSDHSAPSPAN